MKKGIGIVTLALIALALGTLAWTFSAARLEFKPLEANTLPAASPPSEMTLSALPTGSMKSRAMFAYRGGSLGDIREFTMTAFLVRHPKGDLLIDTGFGRELEKHAGSMPWLMRKISVVKCGEPTGDRLTAAGYSFDNFAGVVLTHAHWDHVSGLDTLPGAKIWVNDQERRFIDSGSPIASLIRNLGELNYSQYEFNGGPYLGFPNSFDVWGDGSVVLVPAPGHTPGSIVAFVALPSGSRYAFLGDLVWQTEAVDLPAERPWLSRRLLSENDDEVRENIARIAAIRERFPEVKMVPAHDSRASDDIPTFPASTH